MAERSGNLRYALNLTLVAGFMADRFGVGWGLFTISVLLLLIVPLLKLKNQINSI